MPGQPRQQPQCDPHEQPTPLVDLQIPIQGTQGQGGPEEEVVQAHRVLERRAADGRLPCLASTGLLRRGRARAAEGVGHGDSVPGVTRGAREIPGRVAPRSTAP